MKELKDKQKKIIFYIVVLVAVFAAGFGCRYFLDKQKITVDVSGDADKIITTDEFQVEIRHVEEILSPASDLVTSRYNYKDAQIYENNKKFFGVKLPFTEDKVVFTYEGTISLGIDMSKAKYNVDNENKKITVDLPEIGIISNEIDAGSFEYPFVSDSVFNNTNMPDYTKLIDILKDEKAKDILADTETLDQCMANTKMVITNLLLNSDKTKDFTVEFSKVSGENTQINSEGE